MLILSYPILPKDSGATVSLSTCCYWVSEIDVCQIQKVVGGFSLGLGGVRTSKAWVILSEIRYQKS